ncbi:MAG TPA: helix-turn-helix domain-containing protein [Niastella sp.]
MVPKENPFYQPNIFLFSNTKKDHAAEEFVREHVLAHIVAGELRFSEADKETIGKAGETFLFRRNLLVKCEKRPATDGNPYVIIYFVLGKEFLERYAIKNNLQRLNATSEHKKVLHLQPKPPLAGLLHSIYPYIGSSTPLSENMKRHKLEEAILALLEQDKHMSNWLFDFEQQGKIDLQDFMQRNYMFNVPMAKYAELTGRSLSTFQRDFHRVFGTNAASWLLKRRLKAAYEAITLQNKMPVDFYLDLGFEDLSHFSRTFRNEFGCTPSQLAKSVKVKRMARS